jgi:hypothetical protein
MKTNRTRTSIELLLGLALTITAGASPVLAQAKACNESQIAAAQDEGSAALRRLNAQTAPLINSKLRELQKARGWSDHDLDDQAYEQLEDDTIRASDRETATLITRMETLSEPTSALPACERLVELRQTLERMREIAGRIGASGSSRPPVTGAGAFDACRGATSDRAQASAGKGRRTEDRPGRNRMEYDQ